jgi:hypothetical protein
MAGGSCYKAETKKGRLLSRPYLKKGYLNSLSPLQKTSGAGFVILVASLSLGKSMVRKSNQSICLCSNKSINNKAVKMQK